MLFLRPVNSPVELIESIFSAPFEGVPAKIFLFKKVKLLT